MEIIFMPYQSSPVHITSHIFSWNSLHLLFFFFFLPEVPIKASWLVSVFTMHNVSLQWSHYCPWYLALHSLLSQNVFKMMMPNMTMSKCGQNTTGSDPISHNSFYYFCDYLVPLTCHWMIGHQDWLADQDMGSRHDSCHYYCIHQYWHIIED